MRISTYLHIFRTGNPTTGVGKHIINMTRGLAVRPGVELSVLASRNTLDADRQIPVTSRLRGMPVHSFPLPLRIMEQLWRRLDFPSADHWTAKDSQWIYCPAEAYVSTSKKLAVTIHDVAAFETDLPWSNTKNHQRLRRSFGRMFDRMKRRDTLFLTVSEFSRRRLAELQSIDLSRIVVVGNAVEDDYFQPANTIESPGPGDADPYILLVGGINQRKGGEHIIRLAQLLQERKSPLKLKVAGLHEDALLQRALQLNNFVDLGFINDEQLLRYTRGAAISMMLSRYEGFGIPALEAMAAGVPAIVSCHTALPEIAGDAGIIVQPEDSSAIAEVCHRLIDDIAYRSQVIARGHANAGKYRWGDCVARLHRALIDFS